MAGSLTNQKQVDVYVHNEGTIFLLQPATGAGEKWLRQNCQTEDWNWLGRNLAVEHRYAADIVEGMVNDGLAVA